MRKYKIVFFLLLLNVSLYGQNTVKWIYDLHTPVLSVEGNYLLSSPTIDNVFINAYFNGDYLGEYMKKKTFSNLNPINIAGGQNNYKLTYVMPSAATGSTVAYYFAMENKNVASLQTGDDLFKLFFAGNKQYAGKTINIKENGLTYTSYSQLKGGLVKQFSTNRFQHTFLGVLSLNIGTTHSKILLNKANLYTDNEGERLETEIEFLFQHAKNNSPAFIKVFNGFGTGADFYYNFKCDKGNNFTFAINDLGFIYWLKKYSSTINKDTSFVFEGIEIKDIFDFGASTNNLSQDSLKQSFEEIMERNPYLSSLPLSLSMYFYHEFNSRFEVGAGFKQYLNFWHKPFFFVDAKIYLLPQILISPTFSYGGYAGFNTGLDLGLNYKAYNLYLGTDYLTPFFDNEKFRGKGYYFKLVRKLGFGPKSFESSDHVKVSKKPRKPKYNANIFSNSIINKISKFSENDSIVKP